METALSMLEKNVTEVPDATSALVKLDLNLPTLCRQAANLFVETRDSMLAKSAMVKLDALPPVLAPLTTSQPNPDP